MEELKKFQSSTFDIIARRKSVEDQNTILELSGRIQELQNAINCMSYSKEFQDAESIRSGEFPRYQSTSVIPTSSNSWRNAKPFFWSAEPQRRAAKHLGHTWFFGKRFCKSRCVIISTLILKNWIHGVLMYRNQVTHHRREHGCRTPRWVSRDHQHLKWQQLRSWILSPDCLVAMDKQQTQYQLIPK